MQVQEKFSTKCYLKKNPVILKRAKVPLDSKDPQEQFLQSIVARIPNKSVPQAYAGTILFPRVFWKQERDQASVRARNLSLLQPDNLNRQPGSA